MTALIFSGSCEGPTGYAAHDPYTYFQHICVSIFVIQRTFTIYVCMHACMYVYIYMHRNKTIHTVHALCKIDGSMVSEPVHTVIAQSVEEYTKHKTYIGMISNEL